MTNIERSHWRDEAYSKWHRTLSDDLSFIDIDWMEYCKSCSDLLAIIELKVDILSNESKPCWVTRNLANLADVQGFLLLYRTDPTGSIDQFRVRQLAPREERTLTVLTPDEWAARVYGLRTCHPVQGRHAAAQCEERDELGGRCMKEPGHKGPHTSDFYVWPAVAA